MYMIPDYYDADYVANATYKDRYMDDEAVEIEVEIAVEIEEEWLLS